MIQKRFETLYPSSGNIDFSCVHHLFLHSSLYELCPNFHDISEYLKKFYLSPHQVLKNYTVLQFLSLLYTHLLSHKSGLFFHLSLFSGYPVHWSKGIVKIGRGSLSLTSAHLPGLSPTSLALLLCPDVCLHCLCIRTDCPCPLFMCCYCEVISSFLLNLKRMLLCVFISPYWSFTNQSPCIAVPYLSVPCAGLRKSCLRSVIMSSLSFIAPMPMHLCNV